MFEKLKKCDCGVIDTSPNVKPPYCMIKGEDYDCDECIISQAEKDKVLLEYDTFEENCRKSKYKKCKKGR